MSASPWPESELSHAARIRVLAAGLPGTVLHERVIDAPYAEVWGFVSDLERSVPAFDRDVRRIRVQWRRGDRLRIVAGSSWRLLFVPLAFEVELTEGWCWMVSSPQLYVVGMAAEPVGDRTRFLHLEGIVRPGPRWMRTVLRPVFAVSRLRHRVHVRRDVDGIVRALGR